MTTTTHEENHNDKDDDEHNDNCNDNSDDYSNVDIQLNNRTGVFRQAIYKIIFNYLLLCHDRSNKPLIVILRKNYSNSC